MSKESLTIWLVYRDFVTVSVEVLVIHTNYSMDQKLSILIIPWFQMMSRDSMTVSVEALVHTITP